MDPATITAISTAAVAVIGALTALVKAWRTSSTLKAHLADEQAPTTPKGNA